MPLFSNKLFAVPLVVHFNEIKLVKEDDIADKERWSKNIGAKVGSMMVVGEGESTFKAL